MATNLYEEIQVCEPLLQSSPKPVIRPQVETKEKCAESGKDEDQEPLGRALGHFGHWQLLLTFFLSLLNIPCTFHIFGPTFIGAQPDDFWCARPSHLSNVPVPLWKNLTGDFSPSPVGESYDPCKIKSVDFSFVRNIQELEDATSSTNYTRACSAWEFDTTESGTTTITEWSLVCENKEWANISDLLFLLGVAVGGLTGSLSDKFGRKKLVIICLFLQAVLGFMIAFVPWFSIFLILRTLLGFFCVSLVFTGFVLCMELVGGKWLTISGVSYLMPVSLGYILMAGIAYTIRTWRHLQLAITMPSLIMLSLSWLLPESPRWLVAMGRADKAMDVIQRAAKFNNRTITPETCEAIQKACSARLKEAEEQKSSGGSLSSLLSTCQLRKITLILCIVWFTNYFLYYGLVLNLSHLGGNVYLNSVISGGVELPAVAASILVLLKMGRKWPICLSLVFSGLACLLTTLTEQGSESALSLAMVAKLCVSATNVMLPVYTAELFPTLVRNLGIGVCNIASGASLLFIPYLWAMSWMGASAPMCILGGWGVGGGLLVLLLPETKETLSDSAPPSETPVIKS